MSKDLDFERAMDRACSDLTSAIHRMVLGAAAVGALAGLLVFLALIGIVASAKGGAL